MKALGNPHQFACFACCKSFKRPQMSGGASRFMTTAQREEQQLEAYRLNKDREYKCPQCGGPTHFMGIDFKAPKKSDAKAWNEVQAFILTGKVYYRGSQDEVEG
jgi:hypothetical protein